MGMILRIASSRIVGQGDIVGRSGYFSLNLSANSVMRGRLDARRTLKSLVADLRFSYKNNLLERKVEYDELGRKLTYTDYEYDETGLLTKETIRDPETSEVLRYSEYRNENGLNMEIMVYTSLPTEKKPIELRRITKSYDQNGNLHQLVSEELASSSSQSSFSESYEYI